MKIIAASGAAGLASVFRGRTKLGTIQKLAFFLKEFAL